MISLFIQLFSKSEKINFWLEYSLLGFYPQRILKMFDQKLISECQRGKTDISHYKKRHWCYFEHLYNCNGEMLKAEIE